MWVFSKIGFFSIVQKTGDDFLTIRSRCRKDMVKMVDCLPESPDIIEHAGTDYEYRVVASHEDFAVVMTRLVMTVNYNNFKNMVSAVFGQVRAQIYSRVWYAMLETDEEN